MENEVNRSETDSLQSYPYRRSNPRVTEIQNIMTWIIIALTLAFIFRAFLMEAFRIPTGSMADTLRGDHYHLRCTRCGYKYDLDIDVINPRPVCPNCEYILPSGTPITAYHGDRIFVFKSIYQFYEPKRWDVIVFKNPINPVENYIKRLVGLPGESVQIIDGDIYIDGQIARKPPKVQQELWMVIYDNNFYPAREKQEKFIVDVDEDGNFAFSQPFLRGENSAWNIRADGPTVFSLNSDPDDSYGLFFDSRGGKRFRSTYAYNPSTDNLNKPYCSDLRMLFDLHPDSDEWTIGGVLKKYETYYSAAIEQREDGKIWMILEEFEGDEGFTLVQKEISLPIEDFYSFEFYNVDHQLHFAFAGETLTYDLGRGDADAGHIYYNIEPEVRIFGAGKLQIANLGLYRDIHYIDMPNRATKRDPFVLNEDEFFVCGDNSPASLDSRYWSGPGIGNNGFQYRMGTVPRDYLVGKAFFVYWANAYSPVHNMAPLVPNVHQLQVIAGGSD